MLTWLRAFRGRQIVEERLRFLMMQNQRCTGNAYFGNTQKTENQLPGRHVHSCTLPFLACDDPFAALKKAIIFLLYPHPFAFARALLRPCSLPSRSSKYIFAPDTADHHPSIA